MCKKDVQAKEDILRKGKYFCVESPLCLHEAGKEGYLKQKKGEASVWLEWKSKMSTCKGMKIVKAFVTFLFCYEFWLGFRELFVSRSLYI